MMQRVLDQAVFIMTHARYATDAEITMQSAITGAMNAAHIHLRIKRKMSA